MPELKNTDWVEIDAKLSIKQIEWLGLFKRKYCFLLLFSAEYWRPLTAKEKETRIYPGSFLKDAMYNLDVMFPIIGKEKKEYLR